MKQKHLNQVFIIIFGNTLYAATAAVFMIPGQLVTGGTTGLALVANTVFGIPVASFVMIFNALMFLLGAAVLGKAFALTTLISSFYYPFILSVIQHIVGDFVLTDDVFLSTVLSGLLIGVSIGLVIRAGASTGGMDIPPLIVKKTAGIPVSVGMYFFDFLILLSQVFIRDRERVLYGIILVVIYTVVLDKVLMSGTVRTQVKIISDKQKDITEMIMRELDRGVTLLHGQTGYCQEEREIIMTVISNRELAKLNKAVMAIDDKAFIIINQVNEVRGRGFTLEKKTKG